MACSKSYRHGEPFRGLMVIINNVDFSKAGEPNRHGSEKDVERLTNTFTQLGFEIESHENQTCGQMLRAMTKVANMNLEKYDCLVVVILTHGGDGNIILGVGSRGDCCTIDRVLQPLKDINRGREQGIEREMPKLVFVQACRGENLDRGKNVQADDFGANNGRDEDCIRVPIEADFLYHYSTSPGYYSFRNLSGSVFIQKLCDVYDAYIARDVEIDVMKAHLEVNGRVAEDFESYRPSDPAYHNTKQMPSFVCMLRKNLFLKKRTA